MRPHKTPPTRKDDCLTQCLSRLLNINYAEVPFYARASKQEQWLAKLRIWANKKGYRMIYAEPTDLQHIKTDLIIGVGKSPGGTKNDHAVIINKDLQVIWDPTYNKRRSIKEFGYVLVFKEQE